MSGPVLLAVAHGSRDPAAARTHDALIARIRVLRPDLEVRLAYVDHTAPSVRSELDRHAAASRSAVVVPLLLAAAAHAKGDIPGAIRDTRWQHPGTRFSYAKVLGPHPLLLQALNRRLSDAGVPASAAVVLAAAGSADPDANAEVAKVARLLWEWRGGGAPVEVGFASATTPTVAEAVERLRRLGHTEIGVASYFLAPGRLPRRVEQQAGSATVSTVLGNASELAKLVLERYAEAVADSPVAGCDTCVFRAPWPGHEHRVGAPQRAHSHPLDLAA